MIKEIKLPYIADNVESAILLEVLVSVGQKVEKDDSLAEMESDKATFEMPSEISGLVTEIKAGKGDEIKVGQVMFMIDTAVEVKKEEKAKAGEEAEKEKEKIPEKSEAGKSELKPDEEIIPDDPGKEKPAEKPKEEKVQEKAGKTEQPSKEEKPAGADIPASPSVRRMARELGVDINMVRGTGPYNRITEENIKEFVKKTLETRAPEVADYYELPDFSKLGPVIREKLDTIRRITGKTMAESWQNIPHVFQFDKADVTELEAFRKKYSAQVEKEGAKLTITVLLLKLTAAALKKFPRFNASLDMKNEEIIFKGYVNIGVAVDTDRGLLVPVIRDADKKSITELSVELNNLAEKARNKKIMPADLQGGNFAISNLGGIGGTNFTPIVYRPDVAILGVSRSQTEAVFINGEFKPRLMLPLSLSYDHRAIDGAEGARFLRWLCEALENPLLTMF